MTKTWISFGHFGKESVPDPFIMKILLFPFYLFFILFPFLFYFIVWILGRIHATSIRFCRLEDKAITLIRHQLWPATPKNPTVAIHTDFLASMEAMLLEGHTPTKAFLDAYAHKHKIRNDTDKMPYIYKMIVTDAVCIMLAIYAFPAGLTRWKLVGNW